MSSQLLLSRRSYPQPTERLRIWPERLKKGALWLIWLAVPCQAQKPWPNVAQFLHPPIIQQSTKTEVSKSCCMDISRPATMAASEALNQPSWLHLYKDKSAFVAEVTNPLYGPVDIQLVSARPLSSTAIPALPVTAHLAANEKRIVARLYPSAGLHDQEIELILNVIPGPAVAEIQSYFNVMYWLPFRDAPIHITQQFNGHATHHDVINRFALDFALPVGTPIVASRDGIVMEVFSGFVHARQPADGAGNFVRILHTDGAMSLYAHLKTSALTIAPGSRVKTGQLIGYSGETGLSTGPHLHFAVLVNDHARLRSIPFQMMTPRGQLKFASPMGANVSTNDAPQTPTASQAPHLSHSPLAP